MLHFQKTLYAKWIQHDDNELYFQISDDDFSGDSFWLITCLVDVMSAIAGANLNQSEQKQTKQKSSLRSCFVFVFQGVRRLQLWFNWCLTAACALTSVGAAIVFKQTVALSSRLRHAHL